MSPCSARFDTASIIAISFLDNNAIDYFSDPVGNKSSCFPVLEVPAVAEHYTAPRTNREGDQATPENNAPLGFLAAKCGLGFVCLPLDDGRYQTPLFRILLSVIARLLDPASVTARQCLRHLYRWQHCLILRHIGALF
jgi:hypothetical protein